MNLQNPHEPSAIRQSTTEPRPGLFILHFVCEKFIENDGSRTIPSDLILEATEKRGFGRTDVEDSLILMGKQELLVAHYYMDRKRYPAQLHPEFEAFEIFYSQTVEDYDQVIGGVARALISMDESQPETLGKLADKIGRSAHLVDHILEILERQGHIRVHRSGGGYASVGQVSPSLKRAFGI